MNPLDAINALSSVVGKVIDRLWPDPAQAQAAKLQLLTMQQTGELAQLAADTDLLKGQLTVDAAEAANPSVFVAGARPFILWVCGTAFAWTYVLAPFLSYCLALAHVPAPALPSLDFSTVMLPLTLGLCGLRSFDYTKGNARQNLTATSGTAMAPNKK
jgi:hypothetical protein